MTFVGHSLAGAAIGTICLPNNTSNQWKCVYFLIFILLANVPDLPVPYWGHDRYDISHSLFVNLLGIFLIVPWAAAPAIRHRIKHLSILVAASMAWLSHLLLDSFYNHGLGIAIYWPVSHARLALPVPWFSVLPNTPPPFTPRHLKIYGIELVAYGSLVVAIVVIRYSLHRWQTRTIHDAQRRQL